MWPSLGGEVGRDGSRSICKVVEPDMGRLAAKLGLMHHPDVAPGWCCRWHSCYALKRRNLFDSYNQHDAPQMCRHCSVTRGLLPEIGPQGHLSEAEFRGPPAQLCTKAVDYSSDESTWRLSPGKIACLNRFAKAT